MLRTRGFTLVETLVVLTVLGLAATAVPRISGAGQGGLVTAAAEDVTALLREARTEARRSGRDSRVLFDTALGTYRLEGRPGARRAPSGAVLAVQATRAESDGEGRVAIRFDREGGSTGGGVRITLGKAAAGAEVDWMTGHVRLVR